MSLLQGKLRHRPRKALMYGDSLFTFDCQDFHIPWLEPSYLPFSSIAPAPFVDRLAIRSSLRWRIALLRDALFCPKGLAPTHLRPRLALVRRACFCGSLVSSYSTSIVHLLINSF
jgi:hypothetical protein